jgi:hypothetical protein
MSGQGTPSPSAEHRYWVYFAERIGGRYEESKGKGERVVVEVDGRTVVVDTEGHLPWTVSTRYRALFFSADNFHFSLSSVDADPMTLIRSQLGSKDVQVGVRYFDDKFLLKASDPQKLRELLDDPVLREQFSELPKIRMEIRDDKARPTNVLELRFTMAGRIEEITRLQHLFSLFTSILDRLDEMGCVRPGKPEVEL